MKRKMKIDFAPQVLKNLILQIWTVNDWSVELGWERCEFSRGFKRQFGISAKDFLHKEKFKFIDKYFTSKPDTKHYEMACELGFRDEKALYDYVRYHRKCSPSAYKKRVIAEMCAKPD